MKLNKGDKIYLTLMTILFVIATAMLVVRYVDARNADRLPVAIVLVCHAETYRCDRVAGSKDPWITITWENMPWDKQLYFEDR